MAISFLELCLFAITSIRWVLCQTYLNYVTELLRAGILVEFAILKETTKPDSEMLEGKGVITGE